MTATVRVTVAVTWSETVGLRTRPVWDQNIGLGLDFADLMLCWETRSCQCHARRHNDLEGHSNFTSTIYNIYSVFGTSLLWRSTAAFTYLKVKSAKCLCLLPVVLVLRIWSCLLHWTVATAPAVCGCLVPTSSHSVRLVRIAQPASRPKPTILSYSLVAIIIIIIIIIERVWFMSHRPNS